MDNTRFINNMDDKKKTFEGIFYGKYYKFYFENGDWWGENKDGRTFSPNMHAVRNCLIKGDCKDVKFTLNKKINK